MRQSSEPCTGFAVEVPPHSQCGDYLRAYPLRLVAAFATTCNSVGKDYEFLG
jgi:hypothetical protein